MTRLAVFTDEPVLETGLRGVLSEAPGIGLVGVCRSLSELPALLESSSPDVLLVDLNDDVSFALLAEIHHRLPGCKTVIWARQMTTEWAFQAIELGVRGLLLKTLSGELLVRCVQKVANGELWFGKTLTESLLAGRPVPLTDRESQLVTALAQGLKNKEVAVSLGIAEGTVKVYLSRLFRKLGVKDRYELALYGLKNLGPAHMTPAKPGPVSEQPTGRLAARPAGIGILKHLVVPNVLLS